jgi:hypothetical protein
MNLQITCTTLPGQYCKVVVDDHTREAHTWYIKGRLMWTRMLSAGLFAAFTDERIQVLRNTGLTIEHVTASQELPTNKRVALWCSLYEHYNKVKYRVNDKDVGMMKRLPITEDILRYYLDNKTLPDTPTTWLWKHKQSVKNLSTYWNEVLTSMQQPQAAVATKAKHPNHWDAAYYRKLDGPGITSYFQHLRSLGLVVKKHRDGSILDFVPNGTVQ